MKKEMLYFPKYKREESISFLCAYFVNDNY